MNLVDPIESDEGVRCPGCGHFNPVGLARCERCTGPLTGPQEYHYTSPWPARAVRPAGVTIVALLFIAFGCLYVLAACYWIFDIMSGPIPVYVPAVFAFFALAAIPLAVIPWAIGVGLWERKPWAWKAVIGLFFLGTTVAGYSFLKALSSPSEGRIPILIGSAVLLIAGGITVRWFVNNGKYFG